MLIARTDGRALPGLSPLRQMMPYLLRGRNESCVYFEQDLDLTQTLRLVEQLNADGTQPPIHLFHVILCAIVRTFAQRPQLNRFVCGGKIYQRDHISLSFAIKKEKSDAGVLTTTKLRFSPEDTLQQVAARVHEAVLFGRGPRPSRADQETALVTRLPGPLLRFLMWIQRSLDAWNLLPSALSEPDPLYASMFLANLGSIGLHSAYHHLFEYGTVSFFATVGKVHKKALIKSVPSDPQNSPQPGDAPSPEQLVIRDVVNLKYTFDERITDGYYCARSLDLFQQMVESPEQLLTPMVPPTETKMSSQAR